MSSKLPNSNLKIDKRRENKHFLLYYKNTKTIFRKTKEIIKIIDSPANKYRITKVKKEFVISINRCRQQSPMLSIRGMNNSESSPLG